MRILLVEDDPILALIAACALEEEGHQIVGPAYDDQQALALVESQGADIALVDINLAGHDEGVSLVRNLRQRHGIASVFVSGQPEAARKNADVALGLLRKPYEPSDLARCVDVAQAILEGGAPLPTPLPATLEIFSSGYINDPKGAGT
ncbi:chemotaxis protein CheY [Stutzerimonas stutzeri]|uniref:Chemotaxis protein CheY n=2 Tax=Stutzerimonas stutzeri TaxID=316 RepID=W8RDB4_STUST|nr:response regulator [Stutzerimonas stutzeri]AHL76457.1 chemotaxis protein CheY [Stutzerimonas stutzeri]MCQ4329690.1 response regulator [Stutzerimonas stutzeri]